MSALNRAAKQIEQTGQELPFEVRAEQMAFNFSERKATGPNDRPTHFGPMMSWRNEDGSTVESPSIKAITPEHLQYWSDRAIAAKHPVLRARYAGLIWDLTNAATGRSPDVAFARVYIDAVIAIATKRLHRYTTEMFRKIEHALAVAISISDADRIERVRDALIQLEGAVAEDDKPGLWGQVFDLLLENKKVSLSADAKDRIIQDMEDRLERLSNPSTGSSVNPWASEAAAQRLARRHQALNEQADVRRVLLKVGRAFDHLVQQADPMLAQAWLQQVHDLYRHFGLNEDTEDLRKRIRALGPAARDRLVPHEIETEISKEEMDGYVNGMLEGGIEQSLKRFVVRYIPRRSETKAELARLSNETALAFLMPIQLVDHKGRPIANVGSLDADLDGHVVMHTSQRIGFVAVFLRRLIEEMISRYNITVETVMSWLDESPLFPRYKRPLLERGLEAYLDRDALVALHLLVPQVEDAVRELLEFSGGDVYRPNRLGGMDLRTFDDLLRDESIQGIMPQDVPEYFRILYTDRRGINLRNNLCHGALQPESINMGLADRVFHTIVLLAQFRAKKQG
ncbi:MAG: DUF4209 domain-containing protein [Phycisphaerales bacterium]|nr:DUF4209 domain-containing protein [Phycisphaerales bacterium]